MQDVRNEKEAYEAPRLTPVGSFEALTKSASTGHALDVAFSAGTTIDQLTFSDPPPRT
jgi:hypothetical protein